MEYPGTNGADFILQEADCSDLSDENFTEGEEDDEDFIDHACVPTCSEEYLPMLTYQTEQADNEHIQLLKRKYVSPSPKMKLNVDLSPRLAAMQLTPERKAKRRLFEHSDSGYGNTLEAQSEEKMGEETQVETGEEEEEEAGEDGGSQCIENGVGRATENALPIQLIKSKDSRVAKLGKFKETYDVSFGDLCRPFKSDKTVNAEWVCAAFGVHDSVCDSIQEVLKSYCTFTHITCEQSSWGFILLMLLCFTTGKCRTTVEKLLSTLLAIKTEALLSDPPKVRSGAAAMYWYKGMLTNTSAVWGEKPKWITTQVSLAHITSENVPFDLSAMVQWAYDNEYTEECQIAYEYASLADVEPNAAAFLKSNSQAKHVKDCAIMCRHYKRAEMQRMSMRQWIERQRDRISGEGDWKTIVYFLKYQDVEFVPFMVKFKLFLKGIPKKNCLVFYGPPNTGKSAFCMSLLKFFGGKVVSFMNSRSHFWLQPLLDGKLGLLDDATDVCWDFFDAYLRNAIDGNPVSVDSKHRAPQQVKLPPLLVTTNIDIRKHVKWQYLHSRVQLVNFANEFPITDDGNCVFDFHERNWKAFFGKVWARLDLSDDEDEGYDGGSEQTFRCTARKNDGVI
ncbi:E1 [Ailuropoda melanoleuca papillomavirus 1]|uniref:Replication protein E1 n=1 Tax=Ailuropoda melanoleuca papillomavirus 1 TaxID=2016454 RepID=A0A220IGE2_9PAPI|nr:E1 [Ailuropoda melanoleuca papillomavirus 1]ASH99053.1 E1 [Ailuropoda melanoleuca papillomavirus 1]